jgi:hypothetical protein
MNRTTIRAAVVTGGLLLTTLATAGPAAAYVVPGPLVPDIELVAEVTRTDNCPLQRVGTQFVRCDSLTGNGVAAPSSIPQRG